MEVLTEKEFRGVVEKQRGTTFSSSAWSAVKEVLFMASIHTGFTEGDVEDALYILEKLEEINKEKE